MTDVPIPVIKSDDLEEDSSNGGKLSIGQVCMIAGAVLLLGAALGLYILSEFLMKRYLCCFTIFFFQLRRAKMLPNLVNLGVCFECT